MPAITISTWYHFHHQEVTPTYNDHFTCWPEVVPISDKRAETVTRAFVGGWISRFGIPFNKHNWSLVSVWICSVELVHASLGIQTNPHHHIPSHCKLLHGMSTLPTQSCLQISSLPHSQGWVSSVSFVWHPNNPQGGLHCALAKFF